MNHPIERRAVVVLCGGKSTRMNYPKSMLPFGPELVLQRVLRLTRQVANAQVVVSAKDQELPRLADDVVLTSDKQPDRGPLEGISAGLRVLPTKVDFAFVTSCDVPLLTGDVVQFLFEQMDEETDIVVPQDDRFFHPLLAVYRPSILQEVESLLSLDKLRPFFLFEKVRTKAIPVETLREVDPKLNCLRNLNHPEEYLKCLTDEGFELDPNIKKRIFRDSSD